MITLYVHPMLRPSGRVSYLASYGIQADISDAEMVEYVQERMKQQGDHRMLGYIDRNDFVITRENKSLAQFYSECL